MAEDGLEPTYKWVLSRIHTRNQCTGEIIEVKDLDNFTIGRSKQNACSIKSIYVSRQHCVIKKKCTSLYVIDLDSANGTFLNERKIRSSCETIVNVNDTLGLGVPDDLDDECYIFKVLYLKSEKDQGSGIPKEPSSAVLVSEEIQVKCEPASEALVEDDSLFEENCDIEEYASGGCLPSHNPILEKQNGLENLSPGYDLCKSEGKKQVNRLKNAVQSGSECEPLCVAVKNASTLSNKDCSEQSTSASSSIHSLKNTLGSDSIENDNTKERKSSNDKSKSEEKSRENGLGEYLKRKSMDCITGHCDIKRRKIANKQGGIVLNINCEFDKPTNANLFPDLQGHNQDGKQKIENVGNCELFKNRSSVNDAQEVVGIPEKALGESVDDMQFSQHSYTPCDEVVVVSDDDDDIFVNHKVNSVTDNEEVFIKTELPDSEDSDDYGSMDWFSHLSSSQFEEITKEVDPLCEDLLNGLQPKNRDKEGGRPIVEGLRTSKERRFSQRCDNNAKPPACNTDKHMNLKNKNGGSSGQFNNMHDESQVNSIVPENVECGVDNSALKNVHACETESVQRRGKCPSNSCDNVGKLPSCSSESSISPSTHSSSSHSSVSEVSHRLSTCVISPSATEGNNNKKESYEDKLKRTRMCEPLPLKSKSHSRKKNTECTKTKMKEHINKPSKENRRKIEHTVILPNSQLRKSKDKEQLSKYSKKGEDKTKQSVTLLNNKSIKSNDKGLLWKETKSSKCRSETNQSLTLPKNNSLMSKNNGQLLKSNKETEQTLFILGEKETKEKRKEKLKSIADAGKGRNSETKNKIKVNIVVKNTKSSRADKLVEYMLPVQSEQISGNGSKRAGKFRKEVNSLDEKTGEKEIGKRKQGTSTDNLMGWNSRKLSSRILPKIPRLENKQIQSSCELNTVSDESNSKKQGGHDVALQRDVNKKNTSRKKVSFAPDNILVQIKYFPLENGNCLKPVESKDAPMMKKADSPVGCLEPILDIICNWNFAWFLEQKKEKLPPPCYGSGVVYPMLTSFTTFDEYKQVVIPLMLLNLWASVTEEAESYARSRRGKWYENIRINTLQSYNHGMKLNCFIPLTERAIQDESHPFLGDLCQLDVRLTGSLLDPLKTSNNSQEYKHRFRLFAYVESSHRDSYFKESHHEASELEQITNKMNLILRIKKMPNLNQSFQARLRVIANIRTDLRLFEAVGNLQQSKLCGAILNPKFHHFSTANIDGNEELVYKDVLNVKQRQAVLASTATCLNRKPKLCIIQGPPGTGKTKVIISCIMQILYSKENKCGMNKPRILLCAPSNAAIDEVVERLLKIRQSLPKGQRFKMVRTGRVSSMRPSIRCISLTELSKQALSQNLPRNNDILESVRLEVDCLKARRNSYLTLLEHSSTLQHGKGNFHKKISEIDKQLLQIQNLINRPGTQSREALREADRRVLSGADIVATTLGSCCNAQMRDVFMSSGKCAFSCCIIDEASQCVEPEVLIPLTFGIENIILVGDPEQLPATVISREARRKLYGQSFLKRVWNKFYLREDNPIIMLDVQYRMHNEICRWPSSFMYHNKLLTAEEIKRDCPLKPYLILSQEFQQSKGEIVNEMEATMISQLAVIIKQIVPEMSIAVITPYQRQRYLISKHIEKSARTSDISVNTVDGFQGQECDVTLFSCTRTQGVGFLGESERLNVALTRSRYSLIICGNFISLQSDPMWKLLVDDARSRDTLFHIRGHEVPTEMELYKCVLR